MQESKRPREALAHACKDIHLQPRGMAVETLKHPLLHLFAGGHDALVAHRPQALHGGHAGPPLMVLCTVVPRGAELVGLYLTKLFLQL